MRTPVDQTEIQKKRSDYEDNMTAAQSHWRYAASMLSHLDKEDPNYASESAKWGSEVSKYEAEYKNWKSKLEGLG